MCLTYSHEGKSGEIPASGGVSSLGSIISPHIIVAQSFH